MEPHIRWMIRRDFPQVHQIETQSFDCPWPKDEFVGRLKQRNVISMVAVDDNRPNGYNVLGYMVYELHKRHLNLINIAVHPDLRRSGIATALVEKLVSKITGSEKRWRIHADIAEYNLEALQLFVKNGFRQVGILKEHMEHDDGSRVDTRELRYLNLASKALTECEYVNEKD